MSRSIMVCPESMDSGVINLAIGRYYDAYRISELVLKIERYYTPGRFPAYRESLFIKRALTESQKHIYSRLKSYSGIRTSVSRSLVTQQFYYEELPACISWSCFADTAFALLRSRNWTLEVQIQT